MAPKTIRSLEMLSIEYDPLKKRYLWVEKTGIKRLAMGLYQSDSERQAPVRYSKQCIYEIQLEPNTLPSLSLRKREAETLRHG